MDKIKFTYNEITLVTDGKIRSYLKLAEEQSDKPSSLLFIFSSIAVFEQWKEITYSHKKSNKNDMERFKYLIDNAYKKTILD